MWVAGLNSSKQLAHKLFQEMICLCLEAQRIYVQGPGCIWKESILKHLSLEIKRVDQYSSFSKSIFMDIIWFILCPSDIQTALFGGAGLVLAVALSPGFAVDGEQDSPSHR